MSQQHSTVVKEEPPEQEENSGATLSFSYETVTKQEVMLEEDEQDESPPPDTSGFFFSNFSCPECNRTFGRKRLVGQCIRKHKRLKLGLFECEICQKRSATKAHHQKHLDAHKKGSIRMFKCEICNKRFSTESLLEKHADFHIKESAKTLSCEVCSKRYFRANDLEKHKAVHLERKIESSQDGSAESASKRTKKGKPQDKPVFKCVECKSSYTHRALLKSCMRKHEVIRLGLHECKFCLKSFATRNGVRGHEARHVRRMNLEIAKSRNAKCSDQASREEPLSASESKELLPESAVVKEDREDLSSDQLQLLFNEEIDVQKPIFYVKEEPVDSE